VAPGEGASSAADVPVPAGAVVGPDGSYTTSTLAYDRPEYFDGIDFAARTTC
jgi:hypothetical protein